MSLLSFDYLVINMDYGKPAFINWLKLLSTGHNYGLDINAIFDTHF